MTLIFRVLKCNIPRIFGEFLIFLGMISQENVFQNLFLMLSFLKIGLKEEFQGSTAKFTEASLIFQG